MLVWYTHLYIRYTILAVAMMIAIQTTPNTGAIAGQFVSVGVETVPPDASLSLAECKNSYDYFNYARC